LNDAFAFEVRPGGRVRIYHPGLVVKRFRYVFDPLCLGCSAFYALNRWGLKPHTHIAFFRNWFNDLLLIPCALPPLLLLHRWLKLRRHDEAPTAAEVFGHLAFWSVLFEVAGPHMMRGVTGDWRDVIAYTVGAVIALIYWRGETIANAVPS
jgi:hypothetical protein